MFFGPTTSLRTFLFPKNEHWTIGRNFQPYSYWTKCFQQEHSPLPEQGAMDNALTFYMENEHQGLEVQYEFDAYFFFRKMLL